MKKITCDYCGSDNARSYKYDVLRSIKFIDLCVNCVQDWVLKNQNKLTEVTDTLSESAKKIIHG